MRRTIGLNTTSDVLMNHSSPDSLGLDRVDSAHYFEFPFSVGNPDWTLEPWVRYFSRYRGYRSVGVRLGNRDCRGCTKGWSFIQDLQSIPMAL